MSDDCKSALNELASRVEALTGPDREVDARIFHLAAASESVSLLMSIALSVPDDEDDADYYLRQADDLQVPRYTASIDSAMTLVPEGLIWGAVNSRMSTPKEVGGGSALVADPSGKPQDAIQVEAATPALALTAAALRARAKGDH